MFSLQCSTGRFVTAIAFLVASLLFCASQLSAQTEEDLVEEASIKMKLKKYDEAAAILDGARARFPSSVKVAELTARLYEKMGAGPDKLIGAYSKLIKTLQMKQAVEGKFNSQEHRLFKKTGKKLAELTELRREVDRAVKKFVTEGVRACRMLERLEKYTKASFIFQRLSALAQYEDLQKELKELAGELKDKAQLLKRPASSPGMEHERTTKLAREARRHFKSGRFGKARLACNAALELDPCQAEAKAVLYDIAEKTGDTAGILEQGFSYLLLPREKQSAKKAEEIEKRVCKASPELDKFFKSMAVAADEVCKQLKKATRGKKNADVEYMLQRLNSMTHRTKKTESVLSKARFLLGGTRIFNGKDSSGWSLREYTMVGQGCLLINPRASNEEAFIVYTGAPTSGSFILQFSFRLEGRATKFNPNALPAVIFAFWNDSKPGSIGDIFYAVACADTYTKVNLLKRQGVEKWEFLVEHTLKKVVISSETWHKFRVEYAHGPGKITLFFNGKKVVTTTVPKIVAPERKGYIWIGQQSYRCAKFKDIYFDP